MAVKRGYSSILPPHLYACIANRISYAMVLHFMTLWPWPLTYWPHTCDGFPSCQFWAF